MLRDQPAEPYSEGSTPAGLVQPEKAAAPDVTEALLELGLLVLNEMPLDDWFCRVAQIARDTVPGADEVSVTIVRGKHASTAASTGLLAAGLDERQYAAGFGPCLDSATTGSTNLVVDMGTEDRWPSYAAKAVQDGALSLLSVALPLRGAYLGGLNIYARAKGAFTPDGQQVAERLAEYAAVTLSNVSLYTATAALAEQMTQAMANRAVIEQAKGIIMGERRCSADEAFAILAKVSQDANRKLRDVAIALVGQAQGPATS